ncbi:sugar lactone lactonase YvrE [Frondihabitans sp. PhB188]|uniref:SMP-30/gluconolactonase/LRE family protein n=1 Tax=Frondihabitans sp. PhB188 TaxID=2485200 RepID=UPI000F47ECAD|nr:SMP-30/gluconolactonase/LRE family protein [Frondihabitans sp. PhB188]ROQ38247.1 sugar lactone lactonase YvrE [Frondihabitans sp. PhB188]
MTSEPRLIVDARAILIESPVWDADAQQILWCDITAGTLHRASPDGAQELEAVLPPPLASFQRRSGGGLVVALQDRVVLTDDAGVYERDLVRVEHSHAGIRFNEGKCDPFGNFVVGGMDATRDDPDAGLYRITPSGEVTVLAGGFGTTNGIEFSDDGSMMWVTDTAVQTIYQASYDADGTLGELVPFSTGRTHDGLVRDSLGEFWSAIYGDGEVVHLSAAGELLETIALPAPNVTGITIGGADLTTLYVGSARENATEQQLQESPLSGGLFAVELDRPGVLPRLFG